VGGSAYKEGLYNTYKLDEHFGHPHQKYKTIHVAGTNGKGSCSHTLAAILQASGLKVGLFTSPHLVDFRERIRVNGKMVDEQYVIDFVEHHRRFFEPLHPSFFELTTAMAFRYFADQEVDVAVVEVGLGGRLDCTNIIMPEVCVITNISFDHTNLLGNTLAEIAGEKAGIIKSGVPVVIGEAEDAAVRNVFLDKAAAVGAPIHFVDEEVKVDSVENGFMEEKAVLNFNIGGTSFATTLLGDYQRRNMATAFLAVRYLREVDFAISDDALKHGFLHTVDQTHLLGRWQQLDSNPLTLCDTGHNEAGIRFVTAQLERTPHKRIRFVYGVMKDKDVAHILPLLPQDAVYYYTQASTPRAMPCEVLKEKANAGGLAGDCYPTVADALAAARRDAEPGDVVFVGGSTYVVAEIPGLE
jgi:dihydrofolate synthase/folylpolyglutamate synthase